SVAFRTVRSRRTSRGFRMSSSMGCTSHRSVTMAALVIVSALGAAQASAQETVNYASLSGRVVDPHSAEVPGARVSARPTDTNIAAESVTDNEGRFRFPYLRVGPYEVAVHLDGFADARRAVTLTVGSAFDVSIGLKIASLDSSVTVAAEVPLLETVRSQVA